MVWLQDNAGHKRAFSLPGRGEKKEVAGKGGRDTGGRSQGFPDTAVQDTLGSPGRFNIFFMDFKGTVSVILSDIFFT